MRVCDGLAPRDNDAVGVPLGVTVALLVGVGEPLAVVLVVGVTAAVTLPVPLLEGVNDGLAPLDSDGVGDAVSVVLLLLVVDGVAGGVFVAVPVPDELGVCVAVPVPVGVPDVLRLDDTDGVAALLGD